MKKKYFIFYYLFALFFVACDSGSEVIEKIPEVINKYDPGKGTVVDEILPIRGIIDQTFILNGNFPGELSTMKVYFGTKKAVITATDGISITGLVPKQSEGVNQISLVLGTDSMAPAGLTFKYKQSRSVRTIAGKFGTNTVMTDAQYASTSLDAVTLGGEPNFVATLAGVNQDNILVSRTGWGDPRLWLLLQDDNKLQKLSQPDHVASPAVTSTRDAFYTTKWWGDRDHPIYKYSKADSWAYTSVGINLPKAEFPAIKVNTCTFAEDDNLLYLMDTEARIAEVNLQEKSYKIYTIASKKPAGLTTNFGGYITGNVPSIFGDWFNGGFLMYSKYHKCFFASFGNQHAIYKFVKNADNSWTSTLYAGNNGQGFAVGDRLLDAKFNFPTGMVVNEDGDMFVTNRNSHVIMKISGGNVELVAGISGKNNPLANGDPLEAVFNQPIGIAIDKDGNFFIAGANDQTIRKLSIE